MYTPLSLQLVVRSLSIAVRSLSLAVRSLSLAVRPLLQAHADSYALHAELRDRRLPQWSGTSGSPGSTALGVGPVTGYPRALVEGLASGDARRANCTVSLSIVAELVGFAFSPGAPRPHTRSPLTVGSALHC